MERGCYLYKWAEDFHRRRLPNIPNRCEMFLTYMQPFLSSSLS